MTESSALIQPNSSLCVTNDDMEVRGTDETAPVVLDIVDVDHLLALAPLWEELGFSRVIDEAVPNDPQVSLRTSTVLEAMVLNIMGGRDPLYRVAQAWSDRPMREMLGDHVTVESLNDTALARHLDRLFEAGCESVFNALSLRVIEHEGLSLSTLHADTTSRLVFGEYLHEEADAISITHGYSKDHRPDLKQVMIGMCTTRDGVPVVGQMLDGNTSDKKWHGGILELVNKRFVVRGEPIHYVGDSALITRENLDVAAKNGITITGRLPRTVSACEKVVSATFEEALAMEDLGTFSSARGAASYRGCVVKREVLGHDVQLGVYKTTALDRRTIRNVEKRQTKAIAIAQKDAKKQAAIAFACAEDAERAAVEFERAHADSLVDITTHVMHERVPKPLAKGRPKKDKVRELVDVYRIELRITANAAAAALQVERKSAFVILHTGKEPITAHELLRTYKDQSVVETRFPFLKDPAWADVFFIKTPHRLEALGYVILIALLLWSVWQRRVRDNLTASKEAPLRDTTGMKKKRPTATVCRHILRGIKIVRARCGERVSPWRLARLLNAEQLRVLRFTFPNSRWGPTGPTLPELFPRLCLGGGK